MKQNKVLKERIEKLDLQFNENSDKYDFIDAFFEVEFAINSIINWVNEQVSSPKNLSSVPEQRAERKGK